MSLTLGHLSVSLEDKKILHDLSLKIEKGKLHAIMGPNGSGKSTFAAALMGNPAYTVASVSRIVLDGEDIMALPVDGRARKGLFLAFQTPVAIPGVTVANLLRTAYRLSHPEEKGKSTQNPVLIKGAHFHSLLLSRAQALGIPKEFLQRPLNEAFSGGEKKKLEMLQAVVLAPKYAVFDEIDTGLDVDALKTVATGIAALKKEGTGIVVITHYQRILRFAVPDAVHVLVNGRIVESGEKELAEEIEKNGYSRWIDKKPEIQSSNTK